MFKRKIRLLILGLLLNTVVNSQPISGLLSIDFGDSQQTIMTKLNFNPNYEFREETPYKSTLFFRKGKIDGEKYAEIMFHEIDNQIYNLAVSLKPEQTIKILDLYNEIVFGLKEKYRLEPFQSQIYEEPYSEGDGLTLSAIRLGYAELKTLFTLPNGNTITVNPTQDLYVSIQYFHTKLYEVLINK